MEFRKIQVTIVILLSLFVCPMLVSANTSGDKAAQKPYEYIAQEINNKKIVMLADFKPSSMLSHSSLLTTIYNWNELNKKSKLKNQKLTLVLELSDKEVELMNTFMNTGDINPWLDHFFLKASIEDIYLMETLKKLKGEIEKNTGKLNIVGFENHPTLEDLFNTQPYNRDLWVIKQKDSILADKAVKYMESNPDDKMLFYYSSLHLNTGLMDKSYVSVFHLQGQDKYGYYLAHYLKEKFGGNNVVTYNQVSVQPKLIESIALEKNKYNFIVKGNGSTICKINCTSPNCDWVVVVTEELRPPTEIKFIMSNTNIKRCKAGIEEFEKLNKQHNSNALYIAALEPLPYLTGIFFKDISDFESWADTAKNLLLFRVIGTKQYSDLLFNSTKFDPKQNSSLRDNLVSMGFDTTITNKNYFPTEDEWNKNIWPKTYKNIEFLNAVGISWIGENNEKKLVKNYLQAAAKINLNTPAQYLEWWYNKEFGYSFPYSK